MIKFNNSNNDSKGWFAGPWNSKLPFPIGFANQAIDENHYHKEMYEVYIIMEGTSTAIVGNEIIELTKGDILIVEPGEHHTFNNSSENYLHYVFQTLLVKDDKYLV